MKTLYKYIKESISSIEQFYTPISTFNNGDKLILCLVGDDGHATPMEVVVKKHNDDIVFANPDDDREMYEWKDFVNATDDSYNKNENPQVAVAKNMNDANNICKFYNNIADM